MRLAGVIVLLAAACSAQEPAHTASIPATTSIPAATTAATTTATTATTAATTTATTTAATAAEASAVGEIFGLDDEAGACAALLAADLMTALAASSAAEAAAWPNASLICEPEEFLEAVSAPQFGLTEEDWKPLLALACLDREGPACELVGESDRCGGLFLAASFRIIEELGVLGGDWNEGFEAGSENTATAPRHYGEALTACGDREMWDKTVAGMMEELTGDIPEGGEDLAPTAANLCPLLEPAPPPCRTP